MVKSIYKHRPIVLLTDFGLVDPFVGILKGVICSINPGAGIIDLSHGVRSQDIHHGAFLLYRAMGYFPKGSIFCVVVDPGVGTHRKPVAVKTRDYCFVGPDNGVLWEAAYTNGIEKKIHLNQKDFFLKNVSSTFHGRDIFAPCAAHLSLGVPLEKLGARMDDLEKIKFPKPSKTVLGLVLTVLDKDIYGNLTLNISQDDFFAFFRKGIVLQFGPHSIDQVFTTYGQASTDQPFLLPGSSGFMEIALKNGDAAQWLGIDVLDQCTLIPAGIRVPPESETSLSDPEKT